MLILKSITNKSNASTYPIMLIICGLSLMATTENGIAQTRSQVYGSSLTQQTMTAYMQGDLTLNTYESEAAESKETATSSTWKLGIYAGESRNLGISFTSSENYVPFELNQSYLKANWKDTAMQWRLGWLYPTISVGLGEISINNANNERFDLFGANLGAGVGVFIPIFDKAVFHATGMVFNTPKALDKSGQDISLGQRIEQEVGASIDLTKNTIDFIVGYRTRSYDLTWNEVKYKEKNQGAYTGLRFGLYF
ncbi:MAG: hypothetical protein R3B45_09300 [Bdellovibrionota bacterium]